MAISNTARLNKSRVPAFATPGEVSTDRPYFSILANTLMKSCLIRRYYKGDERKVCVDGEKVGEVTAALFAPDRDEDGNLVNPKDQYFARKLEWGYTQVRQCLEANLGKDTFPVYPGENKGLPRYSTIREEWCEAWNASGDPTATSIALGKDEWGRDRVSPERCQMWHDMYGPSADVPDPLIVTDQAEGTEVGKSGSGSTKGRKKGLPMTEKERIEADLIAKLLAEGEAMDAEEAEETADIIQHLAQLNDAEEADS